jgi:predicted RNA-binding protein YlxR (DUF448 family)
MLAQTHAAELDAGPPDRRSGRERLCAVTREVKPIEALIRFVIAPDRSVVPDLKQKLPGRGVWVTGSRALLAEAIRRGVFAKAFRRDLTVPADLVDTTERLLARAALDALAIAGKAGQVVTGFAKVEAALAGKDVRCLLHATDAAADGVRKLNAALRRRFGEEATEIPVVTGFTSAQLDLALGRANVIHAALLAGPACATFLARCGRLQRFRAGNDRDRAMNGPNKRKD